MRKSPPSPWRHEPHWEKYITQKENAERRGIEWKLTYPEWRDVWDKSGHWAERGREKHQYCMARFDDKGPYAVGNVKIITNEENWNEKNNEKRTEWFIKEPVRSPWSKEPYWKAFCTHKFDASRRSIEWQLSYYEWLFIWVMSGHLHERGTHGHQYCMARFNDEGPYAIWNVTIITCRENHTSRKPNPKHIDFLRQRNKGNKYNPNGNPGNKGNRGRILPIEEKLKISASHQKWWQAVSPEYRKAHDKKVSERREARRQLTF